MKKVLLIGWKDVILAFRDPTALILMLAAPFVLTLGLGFVTGSLSGSSSSGISDIDVVLVNQDEGVLGDALVDVFQSSDLADLVAPVLVDDPAEARQRVDEDSAAAAVIIPAGFTSSIIPTGDSLPSNDVVPITLYANPVRPTGASVVRAVVDHFLGQVELGRVGGEVAVRRLLEAGLIGFDDIPRIGREMGARQADAGGGQASIVLEGVVEGETVAFDPLAYMAPGMALMFLMFTVSYGGRTLLTERAHGTLPRLLVSPTSAAQVLGGKVLGTYLTGMAQMFILILASALLFRLSWGNAVGVLVLVLAAVFGAVGWGLLITALAKTPGQVSTMGTAFTLTFGILGGTFVNVNAMPAWFRALTRITPNAWGLEAFTTLALGGGLADILMPVAALLVMGFVLFVLAVFNFSRRGIAQQ